MHPIHRSIVKDNKIYHIGGFSPLDNSSNIEIWEVRWDYDPGFDQAQAFCPAWCDYDVPNIGGICSTLNDLPYACTYHIDQPQFRQRLTTWQGTDGVLFTRNPLAYFL